MKPELSDAAAAAPLSERPCACVRACVCVRTGRNLSSVVAVGGEHRVVLLPRNEREAGNFIGSHRRRRRLCGALAVLCFESAAIAIAPNAKTVENQFASVLRLVAVALPLFDFNGFIFAFVVHRSH